MKCLIPCLDSDSMGPTNPAQLHCKLCPWWPSLPKPKLLQRPRKISDLNAISFRNLQPLEDPKVFAKPNAKGQRYRSRLDGSWGSPAKLSGYKELIDEKWMTNGSKKKDNCPKIPKVYPKNCPIPHPQNTKKNCPKKIPKISLVASCNLRHRSAKMGTKESMASGVNWAWFHSASVAVWGAEQQATWTVSTWKALRANLDHFLICMENVGFCSEEKKH